MNTHAYNMPRAEGPNAAIGRKYRQPCILAVSGDIPAFSRSHFAHPFPSDEAMTTKSPICARRRDSSNSRVFCAGTGQVYFAWTPPCRESAVAPFPQVGNISLDMPFMAGLCCSPQGRKIEWGEKPGGRRVPAKAPTREGES